jgi:hypothetical protein
VDGLRQDLELVALGAGAFQQVGRRRLAGEEQDLAARQELADVDGRLDAVHVGHDHVADDEVGLDRTGALDGSGAGVDGRSVETGLVEDDGQGIGDDLLVVYDKDLALVVQSSPPLKAAGYLISQGGGTLHRLERHCESLPRANLLQHTHFQT